MAEGTIREGHLTQERAKRSDLLWEEQNKLVIKCILNIAAEDLRLAVNGMIAKITLAIRITHVSKNEYYLVQTLASTALLF